MSQPPIDYLKTVSHKIPDGQVIGSNEEARIHLIAIKFVYEQFSDRTCRKSFANTSVNIVITVRDFILTAFHMGTLSLQLLISSISTME